MATPRFREALDRIPAYKAGKPPTDGGQTSYKLSSNENPYPPLPGVLERAIGAAGAMNRYPDMGVTALHATLADRLGVAPDHIASGAGSVAVLYHLLQAMCSDGDEVVYAWRSFEAYPIAVGVTGATSVAVPLDDDARHDLPAMLAAITDRTKVVLVCTPNNPTGPAVHGDELATFLDAVPARVLVVLDEAYREFVTDTAVADGVQVARDRDNVVVLRTFSKAYGLAGLRVGYGVGPFPVAEAIRKCALPFGVSIVAQQAAIASLDAETDLLQRVKELVGERERVCASLTEAGWAIPQAEGNFVWFGLGDESLEFAQACDDAGVSVRPFAGDGVRVSIGEVEANDRLLAVANRWGGSRS
ncbi:MAG: histidinol-phosphate transaminase [Propionibacteriales bacterium]|nr:histidinol-phosphate transaminase [Propionibacteriales bacterium]